MRTGRCIPGMLWTPDPARGPCPLVLIQHGGSGHKRDDSILTLVEHLVGVDRFAVAAIDGPIHGQRRVQPTSDRSELLTEFLQYWASDPHVDDMANDWLHLIDSLAALPVIDAGRMAWYGLSMGTAYGLAVVARCKRIQTAVLGKWSANHANSGHLLVEGPNVSARTLFIQHWDDDIFDRAGTLSVFESLGATEKFLMICPGPHFGRGTTELETSLRHLRCGLSQTP